MDIIKTLKDNTLLIIPNNIKTKVLKELDTLDKIINIKIMDLEEVKKHLFFDYNKETIIHLKNKYNLNINICKTYLKNMFYLPDNFTSSDKLNELIMIKNNLIENNILLTDNLFIDYIKNKNIIIYGYDYFDKFDLKVIDKLKEYSNTQVFYKVESPKKDLIAYEFSDIESEVHYIAKSIYDLIKNNISLDRIKLANVDNDYKKEIRKIFKFYNIPVDLKEQISLFDITIGKDVINYIKEEYSFYDIINFIKDKYDNSLVNKIINIFNEYSFFEETPINILDLITDDLKNTYLDNINYKNKVEIIDIYNNIIDDDTYVFLMGFNNKIIPKIYKDEDFISDKLKQELNLSTSIEANKMIKNATINILNTINNLTITYKLKTPFEDYYPSTLIEDFNIKVEQKESTIGYNKDYNDIKLGYLLDNLIKYSMHDENLSLLYNNTSQKYYNYDNKYKGIEKEDLYKFLDNKLNLSYSSLDNFYHCKFRYFLSNILKVSIYDETLSTKIGTLFHYILSKKDEEDFDLDKIYETELNKLKENGLTKKEEFYINKLKQELTEIINVLNYHKTLTSLNNEDHEKRFVIDKSRDITINFIGIIDKIMYNNNLISIIDYKTGNTDIDLTYLPHGLKMQLPIYLYLVKNSDKYKDAKICGIYLQKILNNIKGNKKGYSEEYKDSLKLNGYSTSDISNLELFDTTYEKSEMIKGLSLNKDGSFSRYSKILNEEEINNIEKLTDNLINSAIDEILQGNFSINPKRIDNKLIGCDYCEFKDICFRKEEDIKDLEKYDDLDFLRGDCDA